MSLTDRLFPKAELGAERREKLLEQMHANAEGYDRWGVHVDTVERALAPARWLYENYFRVRVHGLENIPEGRAMFVPNHSGQLPFDGMMIVIALLWEADPPRLVRGMIERFFPSVPFVGTFLQRCGQIVGDPENCRRLLRSGQSIMVFPEGARGGGKTYWNRYELQRFGTGFMRLALQTDTPIVPTAVVGAEETYPAVWNATPIAKILDTPYFPITPTFPLLGPLGALPLPIQIDVYFGEPLHFEGEGHESDEIVHENIRQVKTSIASMIEEGLARRDDLDWDVLPHR